MGSQFELADIGQKEGLLERPSSSCSSSSSGPVLPVASANLYLNRMSDPLLEYSDSLLEKNTSLPPQRQFFLFRFYRHVRFTALNVYRRIFSLVFIVNALVAVWFISQRHRNRLWSAPLLNDVSNAAGINFMIAILIRQDYILNLIFKACWCIPHSSPLFLRRRVAKVYEYGGLHSGAAVCSVLWFSLLTYLLWKEFVTGRIALPHIKIVTYSLLTLIWAMAITAYPTVRFYCHNLFEHVHRWAGWAAIILFWADLYLLTNHILHQTGPGSPGGRITHRIAFWCHIVTTFHTFLPWLRLRKLPVEAVRLSGMVVRLHLKEKVKNCVVYRISHSPLGEWHSFACIPNRNGNGGSLLISGAGDWTRRTINAPKPYYYTRGIPTVGVLCMAQIFRKVVIVTTGSGIGPCLGTLLGIPNTSCRVLWSAPGPWQTFGDEICNHVLEVDPKAMIIDTTQQGRLDLIPLAYELYIESGAEAIFCISNRWLTKRLVFAMESRGVPAFGPIWDS